LLLGIKLASTRECIDEYRYPMNPNSDHDLLTFGENLRLACSFHPSIAHVCRRLGLNRQQFNRYLAGQSRPSMHNLRKLGDFFGFEQHEWWLPNVQFATLLSVKPSVTKFVANNSHEDERNDHWSALKQLSANSDGPLERYLGAYFEYYYSMAYPGKILKSFLWVYRGTSGVRYVRLERLAEPGRTRDVERCRYTGSVYLLNERLFFLDAEQFTRNELSQTILFPTYKNRVSRLSGLKLGVSASDRREPACARVVLESLGMQINPRKVLRQCGLIDGDETELDGEIRVRIDNRHIGSEFHFVGRPYS
jgi:transcriptional regulator with XRE-family HTH domain